MHSNSWIPDCFQLISSDRHLRLKFLQKCGEVFPGIVGGKKVNNLLNVSMTNLDTASLLPPSV